MALIARGPAGEYLQSCVLCGKPLTDPIFATSHFIGDRTHELYRYSDAAMHWSCYEGWDAQARFAELYFEAHDRRSGSAPWPQYWRVLLRTASVLVTYGVAVREVSVVLKKSGTDVRVRHGDWREWVQGGWRSRCRAKLECAAIEEEIPQLTTIVPPEELNQPATGQRP